MRNLKDILLENSKTNQDMTEINKILRYPSRSNIKISGKDIQNLQEKMKDMTGSQIRSLKEFLTVVPNIAGKRITYGFNENNKFGTFTIIRDCKYKNILTSEYGTEEKSLTLEAKKID